MVGNITRFKLKMVYAAPAVALRGRTLPRPGKDAAAIKKDV